MAYLASVIGYLLVVAVNGLANALPINDQTTGDIANRITVLFTPAGYVFSIWGLIYLLLAVWLVRQFSASQRNLAVYTEVRWWFVLSCVWNVLWILLWHYNWFGWSVWVMLALLLTLIKIYLTIKKELVKSGREGFAWLDLLPFSVYLGWISVATVANISYVLVEYGWGGFGLSPVFWTVLMLVIATALALIFLHREHDRAYVLVFVWALFGIAARQWGEEMWIAYTALIFTAVLLVAVMRSYFGKRG